MTSEAGRVPTCGDCGYAPINAGASLCIVCALSPTTEGRVPSPPYQPIDTRNCACWPDYSTPDAPSLDTNPDCEAHAQQIAESTARASAWTGRDPF